MYFLHVYVVKHMYRNLPIFYVWTLWSGQPASRGGKILHLYMQTHKWTVITSDHFKEFIP